MMSDLVKNADRMTETLLREAVEKLQNSENGVVLECSSLERLDVAGVAAMERLLDAAATKSMKVTLTGVNVEVYKVLKLAKLTDRVSFAR